GAGAYPVLRSRLGQGCVEALGGDGASSANLDGGPCEALSVRPVAGVLVGVEGFGGDASAGCLGVPVAHCSPPVASRCSTTFCASSSVSSDREVISRLTMWPMPCRCSSASVMPRSLRVANRRLRQ